MLHTEREHSIEDMNATWAEYERRKREAREQAESPEHYERIMQAVAEELGV